MTQPYTVCASAVTRIHAKNASTTRARWGVLDVYAANMACTMRRHLTTTKQLGSVEAPRENTRLTAASPTRQRIYSNTVVNIAVLANITKAMTSVTSGDATGRIMSRRRRCRRG